MSHLHHYVQYFQKENLYSNKVHSKIKESYTLACQLILQKDYAQCDFAKAFNLPFEDTSKHKDFIATDELIKNNFMDVHKGFMQVLTKAKQKRAGIEKEFLGITKTFVLSCIKGMRRRLPFDSEIINKSEVAYFNNISNPETWEDLAKNFTNIITLENSDEFEQEVRRLIFQWNNIKLDIEGFNKNYISAWNYLSSDYPNVSKLAQALLVFPYSSSSVESSFSKLKGYKTIYRNRLLHENIEASLLIQQRDSKDKSLEITPGMIEKYSNLWKKQEIDAKFTTGFSSSFQ